MSTIHSYPSPPDDLPMDPFGEAMMLDPYPTYTWLRNNAPAFRNEEHGFWMLTRYDDVRGALKSPEVFSNKDGTELDGAGTALFGGANMLAKDPPDHTTIRRICAPFFKPSEVGKLQSVVEDLVDELLDELVEQDHADFAVDFGWKMPVDVVSVMLGVPNSEREWVRENVVGAFRREIGETGLPSAAYEKAAAARKYFGDKTEANRSDPHDDLMGSICSSRGPSGELLDEDDVGGLCLLLFAAAVVTTSGFISHALYVLSDHEEERARLGSDPEIVAPAIEELLRLESPAQNMGRTLLQDVTIGGETITAGERVALFFGAANRDERVWEHADTLDFDRPQHRILAFGDGVHHCLGVHLARQEGRIALHRLLKRIPDYEIVGSVIRTDRVVERGVVSLPVRY